MKIIKYLLVIVTVFLLAGCATNNERHETESQDTLYQVSLLDALISGSYDGVVSLETLKEKGTIGIGTFDKLDGEMIMVDGNIYQAKADGTVITPQKTMSSLFAVVTKFDQDFSDNIEDITSIDDLKNKVEAKIDNPNLFYVFRMS
ncbi:MAG: acetolactate decarboxylase [Desulfotomaculaceae bacterium]|nr:acetolactate decarboxylase [Desulfotomaculaceae bacterium]